MLGTACTVRRVVAAPRLAASRLRIANSRVDVTFRPGKIRLGRAAVLDWVLRGAQVVAGYFGRFPVKRLRLQLIPVEGESSVLHGVTYGGPPALVRITLGADVAPERLDADWMLIHELVHLAFPSVPRRHHWIEEGVATYVEPVARVQAGRMPARRFWSDFVRDVPQGQPQPGDRGLDRTHTWARTYWGGALFCFVAEVRIRRRTGNRCGLQHALRGILRRGGNIEVRWPLRRALRAADEEIGLPELTRLYEEMKSKPVRVDLDSLWRRLGVKPGRQGVRFDDHAPLADLRRAITAAPD